MKLILYGGRKYEPFQTKAFTEPELSNFNPALMNISLTSKIILLIWSRLNTGSIPFGPFRSSEPGCKIQP